MCSTPGGVVEEGGTSPMIARRAASSAQRLAASWKKAEPFFVCADQSWNVLNAWRRRGRRRHPTAQASPRPLWCSTPGGVVEEGGDDFGVTSLPSLMCSTPGGVV